MCGFVGVFNDKELNHSVLMSMTNTLNHRGPDDRGIWSSLEDGLGLGHVRLSIIDLSIHGHQPMISKNNNHIIVFNGEIYNHLQIRSEIENLVKVEWNGYSDTETLLESLSIFGIDKTLKKINGMFSFALWNKETKELILARDHTGQKPLYYGWDGNIFFFASELKAIKSHPKFSRLINHSATNDILEYNYIPENKSIYKNIRKLRPASYIKLSLGDTKEKSNETIKIKNYWNITNKSNPIEGGIEKYSSKLEELLLKSVNNQMLSDVPLGAFLSGGIDSSLIVSLMQSQSLNKIKTFTIGFDEREFDESNQAKKIANHLNTDHHELYFSDKDIFNLIPSLPEVYDEPFSDPSALPTLLLSQMTKNHVSVALSGDGGDEIFGGYNRYSMIPQIYNLSNQFPYSVLIKGIVNVTSQMSDSNLDRLGRLRNIDQFSDKFRKIMSITSANSLNESFQNILKNSYKTNRLLKSNNNEDFISNEMDKYITQNSFEELMMMVDRKTYLPSDILVKIDRAAMSQSLETRIPFLDHKVIEFSNNIPIEMKLNNKQNKIILRKILSKYCPNNLFSTQKKGFNVPIDSWLRGPLKSWVNDILSSTKFINSEFFNVNEVNKLWKEHTSSKFNNHRLIWSVLSFQNWITYNE